MVIILPSNCVIMLFHFLLGNVAIPGGTIFTENSDLNGVSPQFTLTCISTGGPATTVTWTRDSTTAMGDEMTVFDNAETAQYTHTLTVTERLGGDYQCTVSNSKPSEAVASFSVEGEVFFPQQNMHTFMHNNLVRCKIAGKRISPQGAISNLENYTYVAWGHAALWYYGMEDHTYTHISL